MLVLLVRVLPGLTTVTDRLTDRQTDRQTGRQTERQRDRETDRETERQTVFKSLLEYVFTVSSLPLPTDLETLVSPTINTNNNKTQTSHL